MPDKMPDYEQSIEFQEPICECGDYISEHENGTGRCYVCEVNPTIPGKTCMEFIMAEPL